MRISAVSQARNAAVCPVAVELGAVLTLSDPIHDRLIGRWPRIAKVPQSLPFSSSQNRDRSDWAVLRQEAVGRRPAGPHRHRPARDRRASRAAQPSVESHAVRALSGPMAKRGQSMGLRLTPPRLAYKVW